MDAPTSEFKIEDVYYLETLEELECLTSRIRNRVLFQVTSSPKTVAQVARDLGLTRPKVHYHMMVLLQIGLVVPAFEKLINGIVEKFYIGRAYFYSYDRLFEYGQVHPDDIEFNKKLAKASNDYMLSVLDISRDRIKNLNSSQNSVANTFMLDFGYNMTEEQIAIVTQKLNEIADLVQAHHLENLSRPDYDELPYHKIIMLMVPLLSHANKPATKKGIAATPPEAEPSSRKKT